MRTLAGAAARLCAGAGLFHFPSLGQRGLIDILKAKPLSLVFVKGLGEKKKGTLGEDKKTQVFSRRRRHPEVGNHSSKLCGEPSAKNRYIQTSWQGTEVSGKDGSGSV